MEEFKNNYLAKSNPRETIQEHTDNLLKQLEILEEIYPSLFTNWDIFYILKKACVFHDLGKMGTKFQKIISGKRNEKQIPHGILSLSFLNAKELKKEIAEKYNLIDKKDIENKVRILAHAIAYHHERKLDYTDDELKSAVEDLKEQIKNFNYKNLEEKVIKEISKKYYQQKERIGYPKEIKTEEDKKQMKVFNEYVMVKGLLNRLDYSASAGIDVEIKNDFLERSLNEMLGRWKAKNPKSKWNELQNFAAEKRDKNIIAVAQTGMGKTEAGLLWIGDNKGFFILPLKTAINAIYERIINDIVKDDTRKKSVGLLHSETMERYISLSDTFDKKEDLDIYYTQTKQFSLPLTICTLDQIFDFVYEYKGFELKQATLSYSKVVLDEIQMYSPELLAYVIRGLKKITDMGGKFAVLTATLPGIVADLLKAEGIEFEMSKNFTKPELPVRHSVKVKENLIDTDLIVSKYNKNKILVICNTVREAQRTADELRKKVNENEVNVFHGKFIRKDRNEKEREILKLGNKNSKDYGIWVTTQVVEASLDIDFDILFTELSDLNGLLQRMGRCYRNRPWDKGNSEYNCYVFIGKDKEKNTGIGNGLDGVVDRQIYELSKELVKNKFSGIITEEEKMKYVSELYTTENLKNTEYYEKVQSTLNYLSLLGTSEKEKSEAQKEFRDIRSFTIIPKNIYEKYKKEIDEDVKFLNEYKTFSSEEKNVYGRKRFNAKMRITDFTMSIQGYEVGKNGLYNNETIEIGKNQVIYIFDCEYDKKNGFRMKKNIKSEKECEEDNFI